MSLSFSRHNVPHVVYELNVQQESTSRKITCIGKIPFYCSTGRNSFYPGTWFPFCGLQDLGIGEMGRGYFLKPTTNHIPQSIRSKMQLFLGKSNALEERFASLPAILISSSLGGGIWATLEGRKFKLYLELHYKEFYSRWSNLNIGESPEGYFQADNDAVNAWLSEQAKVSNWLQLKDYPTTMDALEAENLPPKIKSEERFLPLFTEQLIISESRTSINQLDNMKAPLSARLG